MPLGMSALTSAKLIEKAMGSQSGAFGGGTATVTAGFFLKPTYESFKKAVDKRLTPPTLDLSDEFPEFEPDVRSRLTVQHVVTALVEHAPALFDVTDSAVYLYRDGNLVLQSVRGFGGWEYASYILACLREWDAPSSYVGYLVAVLKQASEKGQHRYLRKIEGLAGFRGSLRSESVKLTKLVNRTVLRLSNNESVKTAIHCVKLSIHL